MSQPELYSSTRAFSHARAMQSPSAINTGIPAMRVPFEQAVPRSEPLLAVGAISARGRAGARRQMSDMTRDTSKNDRAAARPPANRWTSRLIPPHVPLQWPRDTDLQLCDAGRRRCCDLACQPAQGPARLVRRDGVRRRSLAWRWPGFWADVLRIISASSGFGPTGCSCTASCCWWPPRFSGGAVGRGWPAGVLLAAVALLLVAADAFLIEPHWLEVSHWRIASPKIHHPMRIVVVADLQTDCFRAVRTERAAPGIGGEARHHSPGRRLHPGASTATTGSLAGTPRLPPRDSLHRAAGRVRRARETSIRPTGRRSSRGWASPRSMPAGRSTSATCN